MSYSRGSYGRGSYGRVTASVEGLISVESAFASAEIDTVSVDGPGNLSIEDVVSASFVGSIDATPLATLGDVVSAAFISSIDVTSDPLIADVISNAFVDSISGVDPQSTEYRDHTLSLGPSWYSRFNSSSEIVDIVAGHNGVLAGATSGPSLVLSDPPGADASTAFVNAAHTGGATNTLGTVPHSAVFDFDSDFTWIIISSTKMRGGPTSGPNIDGFILNKLDGSGNGFAVLARSSIGFSTVVEISGSTSSFLFNTFPFGNDQRQHLVIRYMAATRTVKVSIPNFTFPDQIVPPSIVSFSNAADLLIGGDGLGNSFYGLIDEIAFIPRAITDQEIAENALALAQTAVIDDSISNAFIDSTTAIALSDDLLVNDVLATAQIASVRVNVPSVYADHTRSINPGWYSRFSRDTVSIIDEINGNNGTLTNSALGPSLLPAEQSDSSAISVNEVHSGGTVSTGGIVPDNTGFDYTTNGFAFVFLYDTQMVGQPDGPGADGYLLDNRDGLGNGFALFQDASNNYELSVSANGLTEATSIPVANDTTYYVEVGYDPFNGIFNVKINDSFILRQDLITGNVTRSNAPLHIMEDRDGNNSHHGRFDELSFYDLRPTDLPLTANYLASLGRDIAANDVISTGFIGPVQTNSIVVPPPSLWESTLADDGAIAIWSRQIQGAMLDTSSSNNNHQGIASNITDGQNLILHDDSASMDIATTNSFAEIPYHADFVFDGDFTIELVFSQAHQSLASQGVIYDSQGNSTGINISVSQLSSHPLIVSLQGDQLFLLQAPLPQSEVVHLIVQVNRANGQATLFIDNVIVDIATAGLLGTIDTQAPVVLGAKGSDVAPDALLLDTVAVYSKLLTPLQRQEHFDLIPTPSAALNDLVTTAFADSIFTTAPPFVGIPLNEVSQLFNVLITGHQNAMTNELVPVSNIRATIRNGTNSFLSITIPGIDHAVTFADRPNADIRVLSLPRLSDGSLGAAQLLLDFNFSEFRSDEGAENRSITVTGSKQTSFTNPKSVTLEDIFIRRVSAGLVTYRAKIQDVNPGDTVTVGSETFVADRVGYFITDNQRYIDVFQ